MELNTLLELIKYALILLCGGLSIYFKFSTKAQTKAKEVQELIAEITAKSVIFIKEAEEQYKDVSNAGGAKFEQVVTKLYALVPSPINQIIDKEMISGIVQSTFDQIEEYTKTQLDKLLENEEKK